MKHADRPRIHVFLSVSDIHILHQLEKDREQVLEMARTQVARAAIGGYQGQEPVVPEPGNA